MTDSSQSPYRRAKRARSRRAVGGGFLLGMLSSALVFHVAAYGPMIGENLKRGAETVTESVSGLLGFHTDSYYYRANRGQRNIGREELRKLVYVTSKKYQVPAELIWAVISVESSFNVNAKSPVGAMGLMQLMPNTAKAMGVKDPWDPYQNVIGGTLYLRRLLRRYDGKHKLALAAYNAGPSAVARYGGVPPYRETKNYVRKVMKVYDREVSKRYAPVQVGLSRSLSS